MSEPKWTKGPYRVDGPDMFGDYNILHSGDALAVGAVVSNLRPPEEVAATAHLWAAAPDMAKALDKLVADYVELLASGDCGNAGDPEQLPEVKAARAALSRARGEAS